MESVSAGSRNHTLVITTIFKSGLNSSHLTISFVSRNVMNTIITKMGIEENKI